MSSFLNISNRDRKKKISIPVTSWWLSWRTSRKRISPNLRGTQGFQCLGHSNWTICSPSSQFCSGIFPIFDFHAPEPISFIPQENEKIEFSQPVWCKGDWVPGAFKLDQLQPFKQILFWNFSNFLLSYPRAHFLYSPGKEEDGILPTRVMQRELGVWGNQTGPYAAP